jgi:hypothetical protein
MQHIVISDYKTCPKCGKRFSGACVMVLDFVVCTDCFYNKYVKELVPEIEETIREYFNPVKKRKS